MSEKEKRLALLPVYLVLDTSASMEDTDDGKIFSAAFDFLPRLLEEMYKSAVVNDKLRVEVITFDSTAEVVFPLGTREALKKWIDEKKANPIIPEGGSTNYGVAFEKLREEIEYGFQQIHKESYGGESYDVFRPVVFFITDGLPNDSTEARNTAFKRLTDSGFKARPNIVCVGVGQATVDALKAYGAGRYKSQTGKYITGNSKFVLVAKDGVSPAAALSSIIPPLVLSIINSVGTIQSTNDANDDMSDPFGGNDDELWDDEDLDGFVKTISQTC